MKKLFSGLIALFFMSSIFSPFVFSATSATKIEITAPTTARVGEAIDITLRAVDKDNATVLGYRGSVIFNTDNIGDTIPAPGKTVTFSADDNGEKKFSKGVIFKKSGKQKIFVYDVSDEIQGEVEITVSAGTDTPVTSTESVTILTPENGTKIMSDTITISGKTRKNSKVNIKLNGKISGTPEVSDDTGLFTKNITGITQETNIVTAELIDGSSAVIATSPEVKFNRVVTTSTTYGVTIMPASTVESSSPIEILIDATPGLAELSINLDGSVLMTKEGASGKYSIQTIAPKTPGTYKIQLFQKDSLGQMKTNDSPTELTVIGVVQPPIDTGTTDPLPAAPTTKFKNIKTTTKDSKVIFDFSVENPPEELAGFKISYGQNADSLNQEVNTLSLDKIASSTTQGGYTWYVDKITPGTYTFKIFGRTQAGGLISGMVSEPMVATIGKGSCTIGNITNLSVKTENSKSIISWEALSGAISYNIYKVSPTGDYALFQNTVVPTYTLYLAKGIITHENFVVKALCDATTESKEYSSMSKVQTGPSMIAIIVILSTILGAFLMRRRYI